MWWRLGPGLCQRLRQVYQQMIHVHACSRPATARWHAHPLIPPPGESDFNEWQECESKLKLCSLWGGKYCSHFPKPLGESSPWYIALACKVGLEWRSERNSEGNPTKAQCAEPSETVTESTEKRDKRKTDGWEAWDGRAQRRKEYKWFFCECLVIFLKEFLAFLILDKMRGSVLNEDLPKTEGPEATQVSEVVLAFWGVA